MTRLFLALFLIIVGIGVGWRVAPPDARERILGFVGMARMVARDESARVVRDAKEKIVPADPTARRAALTEELKQKLRDIKAATQPESQYAPGKDTSSADTQNRASAAPDMRAGDIAKAADEASRLLDEIERVGAGASAGGRMAQSLLERILPAPQCETP
jgi:hypothetical protein